MLSSPNTASFIVNHKKQKDSIFKQLRNCEFGVWTLDSVPNYQAFEQDPTMQLLMREEIANDKRIHRPNKVLEYLNSQGLVPPSWQPLNPKNISEDTYCIKVPGTDVRCIQVQTPGYPPSYIYFMLPTFIPANLPPVKNAIINAVLCLYGAYGITALLEDGTEVSLINPRIHINQAVKSIFYDERPSYAEKETIERQASVIAQLIEHVNIYSRVKITVPDSLQYSSYIILDAYERGFCTNNQIIEYMERVTNRHNRVTAEYCRVLKETIADERVIEIVTPNSILEPFRSYFTTCIQRQAQPDIEFIKQELSKQNQIFADILSLQGIRETKCDNFKDLQYISYIVPLVADSISRQNQRSFCIAVANINERQIGENTIKILSELIKQYPEKYNSNNIGFGGMYLASRIGIPNPLVGNPWRHEHREFYIKPYICDTHNIDNIPALACNLYIPEANIKELENTYRSKD